MSGPFIEIAGFRYLWRNVLVPRCLQLAAGNPCSLVPKNARSAWVLIERGRSTVVEVVQTTNQDLRCCLDSGRISGVSDQKVCQPQPE